MPVPFAVERIIGKKERVLDGGITWNVCTKMDRIDTAPDKYKVPLYSENMLGKKKPNSGIWYQTVVDLGKLIHKNLRLYFCTEEVEKSL